VCWAVNQTPTVEDNKTNDGEGTGTFTSFITGLIPETIYVIQAYATNSVGTKYGNLIAVTNPPLHTLAFFAITENPFDSILLNFPV
jgi:hypothetical protein